MQRKNHETGLKCPIGRMIPGNHLFPWSLRQTILYSPGKSVLFFRARRRPPCREFPPHVHLHSEQALPAFQSGLTCVPTKPCLACNQALLGLQSGLTCSASANCCETGRYGRVKEQGKPIVRQPPLPAGIPIIRYFACRGMAVLFFFITFACQGGRTYGHSPAGAGAVGTPGRTLPHAAGTRERQRYHREW